MQDQAGEQLSFLNAANRSGAKDSRLFDDQLPTSLRGADAGPAAAKKSFEQLMSERIIPEPTSVVDQPSTTGAVLKGQEEMRSVGLMVTGLGRGGTSASQDFEKMLRGIDLKLPFQLEVIPGTDVKGAAEDYVFLRGGTFEQLELLSSILSKKCSQGVVVHWIPMHGEDCSRQVSIQMRGTGERGVEKLLKALQKRKIEVVKHTYNKRSRWCHITVRTRAMMEKVSVTGNFFQIDARSLSPLPSRVIIPQSPFEVIVTDCNQFQFPDAMVLEHCKLFGDVYGIRRDGDNCLITFRDYPTAAKVINDWALKDIHAGLITGSPRLVYDHNVRNANVRLKSAGVSQRDIDDSSAKTTAQLREVRQDLAIAVLQIKQIFDDGRKKDLHFMELMNKSLINQSNLNIKNAAITQRMSGLQDEIQRQDRNIQRLQMLMLTGKCDVEVALAEIVLADARIEELVAERAARNKELMTYVSNQVIPQIMIDR